MSRRTIGKFAVKVVREGESIPRKVNVALISWDMDRKTGLLGVDTSALVRACRVVRDTAPTLTAWAHPYPDVEDPPYLEHDIQIKLPRGKRLKIGYVFSMADEHDVASYGAKFDVAVVLKQFETEFFHLHLPTPEEMNATQEGTANE